LADDFTGDQITDLVTGNFGGGIFFLRGNGDGTFHAALASQSFPVHALATGRLNGDLLPDLAAVDSSTGLVTILLGDGNGNFVAGSQVPGGYVRDVAVGDLNNDQKQDVVVLDGNSRWITGAGVYLGNGDGTFQSRVGKATLSSSKKAGVAVADVNGGGKRDVMVANLPLFATSLPGLHVLIGAGNGTFSSSDEQYGGGRGGVDLRLADFNGDSRPDVVLSSSASTLLRVRLGRGDGIFAPQPIPDVTVETNRYYAAITADFDRDGKQDIAGMVGPHECGPVVLPGNGDGRFARQSSRPQRTDVLQTWSLLISTGMGYSIWPLSRPVPCSQCWGTVTGGFTRHNCVLSATRPIKVVHAYAPRVVAEIARGDAQLSPSAVRWRVPLPPRLKRGRRVRVC
jgi:hypothetical protein